MTEPKATRLTWQDFHQLGISYWLNLKLDGYPNISGVMRDTGLGFDAAKAAIRELTEKNREWLDELRPIVAAEATKVLLDEQILRLRNRMVRFSTVVLNQTEGNFLKLHGECQQAALGTKELTEQQFKALKIKQYERMASLRVLSQVNGIVERLEAATQTKAPVNNIGQQTVSFGLTEEEKNTLKEAVGEARQRYGNNGDRNGSRIPA